jgi:hypothetical protein
MIFVYNYAIDFVDVGNKLLHPETKETKNGHTGDHVEYDGVFFRKVLHACYDVSLSLF